MKYWIVLGIFLCSCVKEQEIWFYHGRNSEGKDWFNLLPCDFAEVEEIGDRISLEIHNRAPLLELCMEVSHKDNIRMDCIWLQSTNYGCIRMDRPIYSRVFIFINSQGYILSF